MKGKTPRKAILLIVIVVLSVAIGYVAHNLISTVATPYGAAESLYWLFKYATGPSEGNAGIVKSIPRSSTVNKNVAPRYTLAFVGDIMPADGHRIRIGGGLKEFLRGSDYLIANFEGVITNAKQEALLLVSDRRHSAEIIATLKDIFPPEKTYLSVANNHAGDFGSDEFFASVRLLESHKFNVFGWKERPYADINDAIRVVAASMWSNRRAGQLPMLEGAHHSIKLGAFNILFAHFGYEFELYPRPAIVAKAKALLGKFDALIGHHPHCPQPVSAESGAADKLAAYSLGNFLSTRRMKHYQYGIAVKANVGQNKKGEWLMGKVEWRLIKSSPQPNGDFAVEISDERISRAFR